MANVLKQYCDGFRYSGVNCESEIGETDTERCLGIPTDSTLTFVAWDEDASKGATILHFHTPSCAQRFLEHWLQQKQNPEEEPKEEPATETA